MNALRGHQLMDKMLLDKLLLAETLSKMGVIYTPGARRKHWDVDFYLKHYYTMELKNLYNKRANRSKKDNDTR